MDKSYPEPCIGGGKKYLLLDRVKWGDRHGALFEQDGKEATCYVTPTTWCVNTIVMVWQESEPLDEGPAITYILDRLIFDEERHLG